jgi:hypothetical protein
MYRGLASVSEIKDEVVKKMVSMLLHPIPAVRISAAETLVSICQVESAAEILAREDWTRPAKDVKEKVEEIGRMLDGG